MQPGVLPLNGDIASTEKFPPGPGLLAARRRVAVDNFQTLLLPLRGCRLAGLDLRQIYRRYAANLYLR